MARIRWGLAAALVLAAAWAVSGRQDRATEDAKHDSSPADPRASRPSIEERLTRPVRLPFAEETSLAEVAQWLHKTLEAPVVIDRAAIERVGLTRETTVQLELDGIRLKTALRLLLDQVGLAYRVEAEDNLIVLTDPQGASEPLPRIFDELEALHRELHMLQDTVDELFETLAPGGDPPLRTPRIIEELPGDNGPPADDTPKRTRPG
jgi:hypothetical protein